MHRNSSALDVDVLVAGSGAPGLLAALVTAKSGLDTLVIESAPQIGGTTAIGGGRVWIPANWTERNAGDSRELALTYLEQVFGDEYPDMLEAFVDTAAPMGRYVMTHTKHRFRVCENYPDYLPHLAGAVTGGRCFDADPLPLDSVHPFARNTLRANGYLPISHAEWERWRYPANFDWDLIAQRQRDDVVTGGPALVAALADAVLEAGGRILTETELRDLVFDDVGRIEGATASTPDGEMHVRTAHVVLATGGYDSNPFLREAHLPAGLGKSASSPANTGIALRLSERHGFQVANLGQGWWMPMIQIPGETLLGESYPRAVIRERGVPHHVIVNPAGRRFVDEAAPYNEFGKAVHELTADGSTPNKQAWMVYDDRFREKYGLPGIPREAPFPENVIVADTLEDLARTTGIDPQGLTATIRTFNGYCETGVDVDFGRGGNPYDRYYGDPRLEGNRCLGTVERAPFYAVRIYSASIGSKGGPVTTPNGQVKSSSGAPVEGLYSVGNASAFWTRDGYPGPGATHTAGMVFAYRAGIEIAAGAAPR
ncbi:FAD-dependent oxidoreductase [Leucobacter celer]|uniref:FAD-dependent oxidoreductase n=1 Tax=Leucobacter celer TaxID=668625 RepID=UPI0006A758F8|nr:FAD-dependent oxidoreductase [Leucobacter celer]